MSTREGELFVEKIEVNLDGRQIFCLFCGGAVIASLVFVLGVTVGRRVEAREHPGSVAAGSASTDLLTALDQQAAEGAAEAPDLAFAATLRGEREGDPLGSVDLSLDRPPAKAAGGAPTAKPASPEDVAEGEPEAVARASAPEVESAPESAPGQEPESAPAARAAQAAGQVPVAQVPAAPSPATSPAEVAPDAARFTLHLLSFEKRPEADALASRLEKAGYRPYVVETEEPGKGTWYRVRVGHYGSFEDAVAGKTDFEKKQQIIAYVTRTKR
jgi:DedD protein